MNDKVVDFVSSIETINYDEFMKNATINSSYNYNLDYLNYDYGWLNQLEQYIPFISNIINRITDNMDINTVISYENRFIRTLILNLNDFIEEQFKIFEQYNLHDSKKILNTKVASNVQDEYIELDLNISINKKIKGDNKQFGLSINERIERISNIVKSYCSSKFMDMLMGSSLVYNPINKTKLFEEDIYYSKCLELYNYIINYNNIDNKCVGKILDDGILNSAYILYDIIDNKFKKDKESNQYKLFLDRMVEKMVNDSNIDEKAFKKMIIKKFDNAYTKKKNREENIQKIFKKNIDKYNKQMKDAIRALKN